MIRTASILAALTALATFTAAPAAVAAGSSPVSVEASYTADYWSSLSPGIREGAAFLDNLDIMLDINADSLWGPGDAQLFLYGLYNNGSRFSETIVGDAQTISNVETGVRAMRLYEAWVNVVIGRHSEFLFGLYDLNGEFDVLPASQLFINSAQGIGTDIAQTGVNGPSIFPVTGLALRYLYRPSARWAARLAALDGVPGDPEDPRATAIRIGDDEGALLIGELERQTPSTRVLIGAWTYTARFDRIVPKGSMQAPARGNRGFYLRGEAVVHDGESSVSAFGRYGVAADEFNMFSSFLGAGIAWRSLSKRRPEDELGIAVAWAEASDALLAARAIDGRATDAREIVIETTYRMAIAGRVTIQPDLQYVINPGLDADTSDAVVAGIRLEIDLW